MTIKLFSISYDPLNESDTFTSGDVVRGRVILEVTKEVKIESLYIKCKGDANVQWTESNSSSQTDDTYSAHERYFKFKQIFIQDKKVKSNGATIVTNGETYNSLVLPGYREFPFQFQLLHDNAPPSFKGQHGSIKYVLEARLSRSWKMDQTASKEFTFVSKLAQPDSHLRMPLSGSIDKKMKLFTSGSASMTTSINKMGYAKGEFIEVVTQVENASSRTLKVKYKLEQRQTFTAQSSHNHATKVIFKAVEDPIPSRSKKTFNSRLKIPNDLDLTITNCGIIKVEYTLKVYLDVPYATDPKIVFPVVILPESQYLPPLQTHADSQSYHNTQGSDRRLSLPQPSLGLFPHYAAAASDFGSAPNLSPTLYNPHPGDPEEPPPSYADIYPESRSQASSLSILSPPPYEDCPPYHLTPK